MCIAGCLTDGQLAGLLRLGSRVRSIRTDEVALQQEPAPDATWPWDRLDVHELDITSVLKLPRTQSGKPLVLACEEVYIRPDVKQVRVGTQGHTGPQWTHTRAFVCCLLRAHCQWNQRTVWCLPCHSLLSSLAPRAQISR